MGSRYNVGSIVFYEKNLYKVMKIYVSDWGTSDPFVYGLSLFESNPQEPYDAKIIWAKEGLLNEATSEQISVWQVLYGRK